MNEPLSNPVFFQKNYACNNNWGRVVGFGGDAIFILEPGKTANTWIAKPFTLAEVMEIRISQYRSVYTLFLGVIAICVALCCAYLTFAGEATRLGIMILPLTAGVFAYLCFRYSLVLLITFECLDKKLKYKSLPGAFAETQVVIPLLVDWAEAKRIPIHVAFEI